jgi:NAD(P)-dependent dehydrogenase (short-subunit alcohol dehydrogenase family)
MRLRGKVAIVTGAASGIGRATAELFAHEGARVVLADIHSDRGKILEETIRQGGGEALFVCADVEGAEATRQLVDVSVAHYGAVNILVNNAAIVIEGDALEINEEEWERSVAVNLKGAWLCSKHVITQMKGKGGSIINVASTHPLRAQRRYFSYATAKGGMMAMTASLAVDFGPMGIRVNNVCPGFIRTPMNRRAMSRLEASPEQLHAFLDCHPLRSLGQAEDVAYACLYLASDESRFVTGATLVVDGGRTIYGRFLTETFGDDTSKK